MDRDPNLQDVVDTVSQEVGSVGFDYEPFTGMWYEVMVERLIISMRPDVRLAQEDRWKKRLKTETQLTDAEIADRVECRPLFQRNTRKCGTRCS
jgi:hypothetical protein